MNSVVDQALTAKDVVKEMTKIDNAKRNEVLRSVAAALRLNKEIILAANKKDLVKAKENNVSLPLQDRLTLSDARIDAMAEGVEQVSDLPDTLGETILEWNNKDGLNIKKVRVPFGVIAIIYEARPNVTVDAFSLCFKTGNVALLRGSSSAFNSNLTLINIIQNVLKNFNIQPSVVQLVSQEGHDVTKKLMSLRGIVDLLIPRGGANLIKSVVENATVPVIETGSGICHVYIHHDADYEMAEKIVINAKTQRPSVCNAIETILIHQKWPGIKRLVDKLQSVGVRCKGDSDIRAICPKTEEALEVDWSTEYLDYIVSIKSVPSLDEAITHVNKFGTKHSEAIITNNADIAKIFMQNIDAAAVYHNASTRFTDGFIFGFGAEMGISTQKLHARGPMGLNELTSYKYEIFGHGEVRK